MSSKSTLLLIGIDYHGLCRNIFVNSHDSSRPAQIFTDGVPRESAERDSLTCLQRSVCVCILMQRCGTATIYTTGITWLQAMMTIDGHSTYELQSPAPGDAIVPFIQGSLLTMHTESSVVLVFGKLTLATGCLAVMVHLLTMPEQTTQPTTGMP